MPMKIDLYAASRLAFDPATPNAEGLKAFEAIYGNLVSYWQVFRPHGTAESWTARQIFDAIKNEFSEFAWGSSATLPNFLNSGRHEMLMRGLVKLDRIKPNNDYPVMAVSKFLHFFNPALFPIYDTEVIWKKVFKCFQTDYDDFCTSRELGPRADNAAFFDNYMCWGSSLLSSAHPKFMHSFVEWLGNELSPRQFDVLGRTTLGTLHATAFEFTAIGAARAEGY
jgi:hypothetical protein